MDLDNSAVERNGLNFDAYHVFLLQSHEYSIKYAILAPSVHASVNTMPVAEAFRESSPFAPMFSDIQYRIQHNQIVEIDIAPLARKTNSNFLVLFFCYLHKGTIPHFFQLDN